MFLLFLLNRHTCLSHYSSLASFGATMGSCISTSQDPEIEECIRTACEQREPQAGLNPPASLLSPSEEVFQDAKQEVQGDSDQPKTKSKQGEELRSPLETCILEHSPDDMQLSNELTQARTTIASQKEMIESLEATIETQKRAIKAHEDTIRIREESIERLRDVKPSEIATAVHEQDGSFEECAAAAEDHPRTTECRNEATKPQNATIEALSCERDTLLQIVKAKEVEIADLRAAKAAAEERLKVARIPRRPTDTSTALTRELQTKVAALEGANDALYDQINMLKLQAAGVKDLSTVKKEVYADSDGGKRRLAAALTNKAGASRWDGWDGRGFC
jgi:predicted RNase H-like nuclease (RuvC/YqgF family)